MDYEPDPDAAQSEGSSGVEEQSEKDAAVASSGEEENGVGSDEPVVIVPEQNAWDWRADPTPGQTVRGQGDMGHHDAEPRVASVREYALLSETCYCFIYALLAILLELIGV